MMALNGAALARQLGDWRGSAPHRPRYQQLAAAVRALVLDGRVPLGVRLPAERELAARLAISRTTVTTAYDALREQGYLVTRQGAGTFAALPAGTRADWSGGSGAPLDLAVASPEADPGVLGPAVQRAVDRLPLHLGGHGYDVLGLPVLRAAVAERFAARGLPTTPDQVLITSGAMGALSLVAQALLAPGDRVLTDVPSYPNTLDALRRAGGRLAPVALLDDGWDLDLVESAYRQVLPRLAYVVADYANPTGHLLPVEGRARVVRAAARAGATLLVDEAWADLRLDGPVVPRPVASHDDEGRVLTVGSMSKSHWGGLRVGWLRGPAATVARVAEARATVDLAPPVLDQLVAVELLRDDAAVPAQRERVRLRRDVLMQALQEACPDWSFVVPGGGLSLWVRLHAPVATALSASAAREGVRLVPGGRFTADGTAERFVRLPYSLPPDQLREAVRRLAAAREHLSTAPSSGPHVAVA
jgi:DNA-binding transcriptional MocR family regulator